MLSFKYLDLWDFFTVGYTYKNILQSQFLSSQRFNGEKSNYLRLQCKIWKVETFL